MTGPFNFYHYTAVAAAITALLSGALIANPARAADPAPAPACAATDTACLLPQLESTAATITDTSWRDQTFRELAKLYTAAGMTDRALALIPRVETPDTRAMTIRGIGMEAAKLKPSPAEQTKLFTALRVEADKITHPPSYGIALTYIAMAQAFAGDDKGAMTTAADMTNAALRNKAYGETAEIQTERGDMTAALASLGAIDDVAFRDKAHGIVAKLFADRGQHDAALGIAGKIGNAYQQSQTMLYVLGKQLAPASGEQAP